MKNSINDYQPRNDNVSGLFVCRKGISTCGLGVVSMIVDDWKMLQET